MCEIYEISSLDKGKERHRRFALVCQEITCKKDLMETHRDWKFDYVFESLYNLYCQDMEDEEDVYLIPCYFTEKKLRLGCYCVFKSVAVCLDLKTHNCAEVSQATKNDWYKKLRYKMWYMDDCEEGLIIQMHFNQNDTVNWYNEEWNWKCQTTSVLRNDIIPKLFGSNQYRQCDL